MEVSWEKALWGVRFARVTSTACTRVPLTTSHREVNLTRRTEIVGAVAESADIDTERAKMWSLLAGVVGCNILMLRSWELDETELDH